MSDIVFPAVPKQSFKEQVDGMSPDEIRIMIQKMREGRGTGLAPRTRARGTKTGATTKKSSGALVELTAEELAELE